LTKPTIIFRADGNSEIGLGHISRCLALAETVSENYSIHFAVQDPDDGVLRAIGKITDTIIILPRLAPANPIFVEELNPYLKGNEIVVLDGYHFTEAYERNAKERALAVVSIDDIPNRPFLADVIFNFCGAIPVSVYSRAYYTQVFLGLDYLFLRSPFLKQAFKKKEYNDRLFLNMGGADPNNATLKVLTELIQLKYTGKIEVVVGNSYLHADSLRPLLNAHKSITVRKGLDADEMFDVMTACAIAIVPPSTVALEFLTTGGLLFLYQTADNQALLNGYLVEKKLAHEFRSVEFNSSSSMKPLFETMVNNQKGCIDGLSAARIKKIFSNLSLAGEVSIRRVTQADCEQCFQWANDPEARKYSYTTEPIPWENHVRWFTNKLADSTCVYFIAQHNTDRIGQIRFDSTDTPDCYQISYSIDKEWRGKGLSHPLLIKGIEELRKIKSVRQVIGYVQAKNTSSDKAFQRAGFKKLVSTNHQDSFKFELSL
jgi:UDP-2,4-diacetamido-2,4,6-trideoxy-beta-L-altropyranose hydrolase